MPGKASGKIGPSRFNKTPHLKTAPQGHHKTHAQRQAEAQIRANKKAGK